MLRGEKHHKCKGEVEEDKSLKYRRKKEKTSTCDSKGDIYRQTHEVSSGSEY